MRGGGSRPRRSSNLGQRRMLKPGSRTQSMERHLVERTLSRLIDDFDDYRTERLELMKEAIEMILASRRTVQQALGWQE